MWGRPLDTAMMDPWYREQFTDAHAVVVSDQERAGLDILTTGDYHLDEDVAGRSWHHYPLQRWKGLEHEELQTRNTRSPLLSYPVGTMLDSIYKTWRWPRVVGKIEHDPKNPLEYPKIWRIAQQSAASGKPVKFGTCSAQVLAFFLDSHTGDYDLDDKKQLTWDMAEAMNLELRQLAAAGCNVIQVEEPTLHFMARYYPEMTELIDFLVDCFNREIEGLDDVEVWIHTCWGNPNMQRVIENDSYKESFQLYLEACLGDVWTLEMKDRGMREIELFAPLNNQLKKKICIGVVSHRKLQVESAEEVADTIRTALKYIPPEQLIISSDCGFGRQGCNRDIAFFKTVAIAQGTNIVRRELGLPESKGRASDPALQTDIVPKTAAAH
jgi:5-methyltetrahydropteroyltriglutamate--homocysteine methyltransferase